MGVGAAAWANHPHPTGLVQAGLCVVESSHPAPHAHENNTRFPIALAAPLCFGGLLPTRHTLESETNSMAGNRAAIAAFSTTATPMVGSS
jgi:hypothetical protein